MYSGPSTEDPPNKAAARLATVERLNTQRQDDSWLLLMLLEDLKTHLVALLYLRARAQFHKPTRSSSVRRIGSRKENNSHACSETWMDKAVSCKKDNVQTRI